MAGHGVLARNRSTGVGTAAESIRVERFAGARSAWNGPIHRGLLVKQPMLTLLPMVSEVPIISISESDLEKGDILHEDLTKVNIPLV